MPASSPDVMRVAVYMSTPSAFVGVGINAAPMEVAIEFTASSQAGTAAINVTLPGILANVWGSQTVSGSISAILPALQAQLIPGGYLNADLPGITAALTALKGAAGVIDVLLPAISAQMYSGWNLNIGLPAITAALTGTTEVLGTLDALLPGITAELSGIRDRAGTVNATLPAIRAALTGYKDYLGTISAALPAIRARMIGGGGIAATLSVPMPPIKAVLLGRIDRYGTINVTLPAITGALEGPTLLRGLPKAFGLVENTRNFANSTYENGFQFNSIILFNGQYIGCNNSGLYLIGGKFDNAAKIDAKLTIPPLDFGKDVYNFVRDVWMMLRNDGPIKITVEPDEGSTYSYQTLKVDENVHEERVKLGRGLKPRFYAFTIENIMGARFTLDSIDFLGEPAVQRKR